MDTANIRKLTPYQDINSILVDWTEKAKKILGENVVGLYLSGSLSYGDFVPERSDIDLQAVVRPPLNQSELNSIEQLHRGLDEQYPAWKGRLECSYVPIELMQEVLPPKISRPWWGFDTLYSEADAGNEWIINHYFLSKQGERSHQSKTGGAPGRICASTWSAILQSRSMFHECRFVLLKPAPCRTP
ncbi:MAG: hypothetical protein J2P21_15040 [Chloracidobacterium sp.]|nr:hypothetical protein [Chloracidobacterium sp.]